MGVQLANLAPSELITLEQLDADEINSLAHTPKSQMPAVAPVDSCACCCTGFIGWPVLVATIGAKGATLSMLLSKCCCKAFISCSKPVVRTAADQQQSSGTEVRHCSLTTLMWLLSCCIACSFPANHCCAWWFGQVLLVCNLRCAAVHPTATSCCGLL